jgi:tellurite methyltransferase
MFDEIRELNRQSISNYFEVYLKVPVSIRKQRDSKGIYASPIVTLDSSTEPKAADIVVLNFGDVSPQVAAEQVVSSFINKFEFSDENQTENKYVGGSQVEYWNRYYKTAKAPVHPSTFAIFCQEKYFASGSKILEFGCGNGRDSFWLAQSNLVLAIDRSLEAITTNIKRRDFEGITNLKFEKIDFGVEKWSPPYNFDAVYARFVLHSMTKEVATQAILKSYEVLNEGGLLLLEFRTTKDSLMQSGEKVSPDERITDHYRRFIDFNEATNSISEAGFRVEYSIESKGLAIHRDEDPVVARIIARK